MSGDRTTDGALAGLRVLDMSRVLAGPWVGQTLGDLGAEVIKIERPGGGDDTRSWGPPYLADKEGRETSDAAYFLCANRNKRSVTIDIAKPAGQALVRSLALQSDVLIENFKVGGLAPYGLDEPSLRAVNPQLVYCSITGFGQTGPYAHRAGYDFLIQAMGGLMSITGVKDGEPGAGPQKVGVALTDIITGLYATIGILAALAARQKTGRGQHVDLALLDAQIASLANQASNYLISGRSPSRLGNAHPNIVPYQDVPTFGGSMILAVGNDEQFSRLCETLGHPEWATDTRFATNRARVNHRAALIPMIEAVTLTKPTAEWITIMEGRGIPCGPVNTIENAFADPHVAMRGMQVTMNHALAGSVPLVGSPIHLSETPVLYRHPPPRLGEHTAETLAGILDLSAAEIEALAAAKVI